MEGENFYVIGGGKMSNWQQKLYHTRVYQGVLTLWLSFSIVSMPFVSVRLLSLTNNQQRFLSDLSFFIHLLSGMYIISRELIYGRGWIKEVRPLWRRLAWILVILQGLVVVAIAIYMLIEMLN